MALPNTLYSIPQQWTNPVTDLTDFVAWIPAANLPQSFIDAIDTSDYTKGRAAKNDGTEIASDWSAFDHNAVTGGIWVFWSGTLSSTSNQVPRLYPPKAANASYAPGSTYGSESVWVNDYLVTHDGGGGDASGNNYTMTPNGGITIGGATSPFGDATTYDGSDDYIQTNSVDAKTLNDFEIMTWVNLTSTGGFNVLFWQGDVTGNGGGGELEMDGGFENATTGGTAPINFFIENGTGNATDDSRLAGGTNIFGSWQMVNFVANNIETALSESTEIWQNGVNQNEDLTVNILDRSGWDTALRIGGVGTLTRMFSGSLAEFRLRQPVTDDYRALEYDNQNDPATFWGEWTIAGEGSDLSSLFANGEAGGWYDADKDYLYQDTAGTTPVTADGQSVARWEDKSGNGHHLINATAAEQPTYREVNGIGWVEFDGIDDMLQNTTINIAQRNSVGFATRYYADATRYYYITGDGSGTHQIIRQNEAGDYPMFFSGASYRNASLYSRAHNVDFTFLVDFNGASTYYYTDNQQDGPENPGPDGQVGLTVGRHPAGANPLDGRMYNVLITDDALTAEERALFYDHTRSIIIQGQSYFDTIPAGGGDQTITVGDAGAGADNVSLSASLAVADAGLGTDSPVIQNSLAVQDAGGGLDDVTIAALLEIADAGLGSDAISIIQDILKTVSDAGTGSDAVSIANSLSVLDNGTGTDVVSLEALLQVVDAGLGTDAINILTEILKTVSDAGSGSDSVSVSASLSVVDTGGGLDTVQIDVSLLVQDTGSGADAVSLIQEKLVTIADAGQGSDQIAVNVQVQMTDEGFASESVAIQNTLAVLDNASGIDSVVRFDTDVFIASITFTFAKRRFGFTLTQRQMVFELAQRDIGFTLKTQ